MVITMTDKLSVCIISYNDAPMISDCLSRLDGFSLDIIVADIGSSDGTVDMAKRHGARVYEISWNGSFSDVRNFCTNQAKGRWVLFLQANEIIDIAQIDPLLKNPNAEAYLMTIDYRSERFCIASPVQALRLVRRHEGNNFQYRSFEMMPDEILTGVADARILIRQQNDAMSTWQLNMRISMLKDELAQNPNNCYLQYMQGLMLLNMSQFSQSAAMFEAAKKNVNIGFLYAPHLYKCLSYAYLCLELHSDAMRVLDEGVEYLSFYSDLLILRAELYHQLGQMDRAIQDLRNCLKIRECPHLSVPPPEIGNTYIYESLGDIYAKTLKHENALDNYLQAYQCENSDADLSDKICRMFELTGSTVSIDEFLDTTLEDEPLATRLRRLKKLRQ